MRINRIKRNNRNNRNKRNNRNQRNNRTGIGMELLMCILGVLFIGGCTNQGLWSQDLGVEQYPVEVVTHNTETPTATKTPTSEEGKQEISQPTSPLQEGENPPAPALTWIENLDIPEYQGQPYAVINDNEPFFDCASQKPEAYEIYYALDNLGRCTLADAVVGIETQPTEKRGNISEIHPTGWHKDKYDFVNGKSLYNRCHLIAYYLSAENANPNNLITGTRYMNEDGMNDFENMVGDYIKESGNHVRYRVTPVWTGNNLVCDGVLMEAYSIEDQGDNICFCVFCYNVQPGVVIDYATGDNHVAQEGDTARQPGTSDGKKPSETVAPSGGSGKDSMGDYVLNTYSKKFHLPTCEGALEMSQRNRKEYSGSREALIEEGYIPCGLCKP